MRRAERLFQLMQLIRGRRLSTAVFQADLLGIPVVRPKVIETTALGAACLAGLSCGVYAGLDELGAQWQVERTFRPTLSRERANELMANWERAVRQTVTT